ncbi:unnamed protein product [Ectocarpus sp. 8 AP-2014]
MTSANERHARTLEAIQAQRASFAPTVIPASTSVVEEDYGLPEAEPTPEPTPAAEESEEEEMAVAVSDDVGSTTDNVELESVAAFIASYAGEQEAAAKANRLPTKPSEPPFLVPRGMSVVRMS